MVHYCFDSTLSKPVRWALTWVSELWYGQSSTRRDLHRRNCSGCIRLVVLRHRDRDFDMLFWDLCFCGYTTAPREANLFLQKGGYCMLTIMSVSEVYKPSFPDKPGHSLGNRNV